MSNCLDAESIRAMYLDDVLSRSLVLVSRNCVAVGCQLDFVPVGLNVPRRAPIAKIPGLIAMLVTKASHLKCHLVPWLDSSCWEVVCMDRGRDSHWIGSVANVHVCKIIGHISSVVGHSQDFAVFPRLIIGATDNCAGSNRAISELPFEPELSVGLTP